MLTELKNDDPLLKELSNIACVLEATSFEYRALWAEHEQTTGWIDNTVSKLITVGAVLSKPVCVSLTHVMLHGKKLLVLDATSEMVDWGMIETWVGMYVKDEDGNAVRIIDATNFHNVLHTIRAMNLKSAA